MIGWRFGNFEGCGLIVLPGQLLDLVSEVPSLRPQLIDRRDVGFSKKSNWGATTFTEMDLDCSYRDSEALVATCTVLWSVLKIGALHHPYAFLTPCGKNFRDIGPRMRVSKKLYESERRNKVSYNYGLGPALHSEGLRSFKDNARKLAAESGQPVSHSLLFVTTHQRKEVRSPAPEEGQG